MPARVRSPVWPRALPRAPCSAPSSAEPAVPRRATPQRLRQAWQLSWWPRGRATYGLVPEQSKRAAPRPRAPRGGPELPRRPQGLPWLRSQLGRGRRPSSPWRLAAAVCSLGPAPWTLAPDKAWGRAQHHSPWAQVPPSQGHAAPAPGGCGPGVPSRGIVAASPVPEAPEGSALAVWLGLVAARLQHYNAWQRDQHSPAGARGPVGVGLPPRRCQPQPGPLEPS